MEFISGAELTAEHEDTEVHILGYFLDTQSQALLDRIAKFQAVRQNRINEMCAALNKLGIPLQAETVFALANCKSPGRPHVARALVKEKLIGNLDEAFEKYLKKGRPAWVPKTKMSALEGVEMIHQAGGLAVMAHPGLNRTDDIIPDLVDAGLDGIECFHTKHSTVMAERYLEIAEKYRSARHRRQRLPRLQQKSAAHQHRQAALRTRRKTLRRQRVADGKRRTAAQNNFFILHS